MIMNQHYSLYLEYSILHSIINNGYNALEQSLLVMKNDVNHFYNENHRIVFNTMVSMYNKNRDLNQLTVYDQVSKTITAPKVLKILFAGISKGEILDDLQEPCMRLVDYSIKRQLIETASQINNNVKDTGFEILTQVSNVVHNITETYLPSNIVDSHSIKEKALSMVLRAKEFRDKGEFPGIPTGFFKLDQVTGGLKPGQLIVIAARPSMGKTSFVLSSALNASSKYPIAIFSLEMEKETLMLRLASQYAKVDLSKLLNGDIHEHEVEKVSKALDDIAANHNIIIDDDPGLDTTLLRAKVRRYIQQFGVKAIFIDYLQLMKFTGKAQNREREVAIMSWELKHIAREFKIPVVILAQLNRDVEHRSDKTPMLADLRESGAIEQDADLVIFLYRPEYYGIKVYDNADTYNTCQVVIGKQRNGALSKVMLTYVKEYAGFYNYIVSGVLPATNHQPFEESYEPPAWAEDNPF